MNDDEAAARVIKLLGGEMPSYVNWIINEQVIETPVLSGMSIKVPRGAKAWYSWRKNSRYGDRLSWSIRSRVSYATEHHGNISFEVECE